MVVPGLEPWPLESVSGDDLQLYTRHPCPTRAVAFGSA